MVYRNTKTGATIEVTSTIKGGLWVCESTPATPIEESKKAPKKTSTRKKVIENE